MRGLALTVDAGLSLGAWWLRDADAIHANLGRLASVGNTGTALLVLALGTDRDCHALAVFWAKASGTGTQWNVTGAS